MPLVTPPHIPRVFWLHHHRTTSLSRGHQVPRSDFQKDFSPKTSINFCIFFQSQANLFQIPVVNTTIKGGTYMALWLNSEAVMEMCLLDMGSSAAFWSCGVKKRGLCRFSGVNSHPPHPSSVSPGQERQETSTSMERRPAASPISIPPPPPHTGPGGALSGSSHFSHRPT